MTVTLRADQWQEGPPVCPMCVSRETQQIFKAPAINGSPARRAADMALDIAEKDYKISDISDARGEQGSVPKVRYRGEAGPSTWGSSFEALQTAITVGRQTRQQFGSGLDVLQTNLRSGAQPDLIELSKKRSTRVF